MADKGGGQTQSQVQTRDPYGPAQPALQSIISQAGNLYNSGAGSQLWNGPLIAPQSDYTRQGLAGLASTASSQAPTIGLPFLHAQDVSQGNGLTSQYNAPLSTYGNVASGQNGITTGGDFANVANAAGQPTATAQYLTPFANGSQADNPYLQQMLASNDARIANRVNSSFAGLGRYGSAGHSQALVDQLTAADNPVLYNAYNDQQNRQMQAAQAIDAATRAAQSTQLGALQGQTGTQAQNISNQLAGAGGQAGILNFGQGNAANWAGLLPQLNALSYAPGNALLTAGAGQDAYNQQDLAAQQNQFNQQQQMPWTQLSKYLGAVTGLSPLIANAGTTTGTGQTQNQLGLLDYAKLFAGGGNSAAAGGANALSSILGFLSDRNEKTDIKKLGEDETTGLPIYSYRYKSDPKTYPKLVGPMAQDIEALFPGSTDRIGGKLYVKPEAAGLLGAR